MSVLSRAINGLAISTAIEIAYATHDQAISMIGLCQVKTMLGLRPLCLSKSWVYFSPDVAVVSRAVIPKRAGHERVKLSRNCVRASSYILYFAESHGSSATLSVL